MFRCTTSIVANRLNRADAGLRKWNASGPKMSQWRWLVPSISSWLDHRLIHLLHTQMTSACTGRDCSSSAFICTPCTPWKQQARMRAHAMHQLPAVLWQRLIRTCREQADDRPRPQRSIEGGGRADGQAARLLQLLGDFAGWRTQSVQQSSVQPGPMYVGTCMYIYAMSSVLFGTVVKDERQIAQRWCSWIRCFELVRNGRASVRDSLTQRLMELPEPVFRKVLSSTCILHTFYDEEGWHYSKRADTTALQLQNVL